MDDEILIYGVVGDSWDGLDAATLVPLMIRRPQTWMDMAPATVGLAADQRQQATMREIAEKNRDYDALRDGIYTDILHAIETGAPVGSAIRLLEVKDRYPVCVAGVGELQWHKPSIRGVIERILMVLAVLPSADGTTLLAVAEQSGRELLDHYLERCLQGSPWGILNQIEAWMLYHTDHWFVRPSAWTVLPAARRQVLCQEMREGKLVGVTSPLSIFDDIRRDLLNRSRTAGEDASPEFAAFLDAEQAKLDG